jgi:hypothetical protein
MTTCTYANPLPLIRRAADRVGMTWPQCDAIAPYIVAVIEDGDATDVDSAASAASEGMDSAVIYTHALWTLWAAAEAYAYDADDVDGSMEDQARWTLCAMASDLARETVALHNAECESCHG